MAAEHPELLEYIYGQKLSELWTTLQHSSASIAFLERHSFSFNYTSTCIYFSRHFNKARKLSSIDSFVETSFLVSVSYGQMIYLAKTQVSKK